MLKAHYSLSALISVLLVLPGQLHAETKAPDGCESIIVTIVDNIRKNTLIEAPVLNPDKLAFFMEHGYRADIPYQLTSEENDYGRAATNELAFKRRGHIRYLLQLAMAHQHPSSQHYQDPQLLAAIAKGYDFWFQTYWIENQYVPSWWYRRIGFLKEFMQGAVLLKEVLTEQYPETVERIIEYGIYAWTQDKANMFGANALDVARISMMVALMAENCELLNEVVEFYQSMILPRTTYLNPEGREELMHTEGFQVDMNFNQHPMHGRQLYLGSYGLSYLSQLTKLIHEFRGTPFKPSQEMLDALQNYFFEGVAWMFYRGFVDPAQLGRTIERRRSHGIGRGLDYRGSIAYSSILTLSEVDGVDRNALLALAETLTDDVVGNEVIGNRMYWRFDYMVHRRSDYYISYRMTSTRTIGNEAGNQEGENYYYTGDGWNSILVEGDEYKYIYPHFDWRRLPGTTILQRTGPLPIGQWGDGLHGGSEFAGGCSNGNIGAAAFILSRDGLYAHKAQFFFDWGMIALGAGIEVDESTIKENTVPLMTTLNQTWASKELPLQHVSSSDPRGVHLWHNSIGYVSLDRQPLQTRLQMTPKGREILWIGVEHPLREESSYAYMMLPSISAQTFTEGHLPEVDFLNTKDCQMVIAKNENLNVLQAVIYTAGKHSLSDGLYLTVDQPVVLLFTHDAFTGKTILCAANPYADRKIISSVSIEIINLSDKRFPIGLFPLQVELPQGFYSGQSVKISFED